MINLEEYFTPDRSLRPPRPCPDCMRAKLPKYAFWVKQVVEIQNLHHFFPGPGHPRTTQDHRPKPEFPRERDESPFPIPESELDRLAIDREFRTRWEPHCAIGISSDPTARARYPPRSGCASRRG
jgi:hypothetical protein